MPFIIQTIHSGGGRYVAEQPDQIPQFLTVRPSPDELNWMRRGLGQPGGKIPVFDENDNPVDPKIVRRCLEQQWVEPWIGNQKNPDNLYMACRLSPLGRRLVGREPQLVDRPQKDRQEGDSEVSRSDEGQLDRDKKNQMLLESLEVMAHRSRRNIGINPRVARAMTIGSLAVLLLAVPLVIWQGWRLMEQSETPAQPETQVLAPAMEAPEPEAQVAEAVPLETAEPLASEPEANQAEPSPPPALPAKPDVAPEPVAESAAEPAVADAAEEAPPASDVTTETLPQAVQDTIEEAEQIAETSLAEAVPSEAPAADPDVAAPPVNASAEEPAPLPDAPAEPVASQASSEEETSLPAAAGQPEAVSQAANAETQPEPGR